MFGGRLSEDFIADKVGHSNFTDLVELDFPQCSIQSVTLGDGHLFLNLRRFFTFLTTLDVYCPDSMHILGQCVTNAIRLIGTMHGTNVGPMPV